MTGNLFIDSLISLGAIGLMVLAAWTAFHTPVVPLDEKQARERLAFDEPDFKPRGFVFDPSGKVALVEGGDDELALLFRHGAELVTRRFFAGMAQCRVENGVLKIKPNDPGANTISLVCAEPAMWARKISGEC